MRKQQNQQKENERVQQGQRGMCDQGIYPPCMSSIVCSRFHGEECHCILAI